MAAGWKLVFVMLAALGLMVLIMLAAAGGRPIASLITPIPTDVASVPSFDHVYLVIMENKSAGAIVGSENAPYLNELIKQNGLATNYTAVAHPSQPNYIALWSGSTQGVRDDRVHRIDAENLGNQLEAAGKTWRVFAENVPTANAAGQPVCYVGATASRGPDGDGTYARKHEPAISFLDLSNNPSRCIDHITDFSHFDPSTANFELVIPNLCHDMHDCSVNTGDNWLRNWLPSHILDTPVWKNTNSAIFITWDEGTDNSGGGGKVATIVISKQTPAGFTSDVPHDHYSLLRTIESAFGLGCLKNTCNANTLGEFFK